MNAIHEAPYDTLHTPYIRPSENGSRSGVYWVQFNDGRFRNKSRKYKNQKKSPQRKPDLNRQVLVEPAPITSKIWGENSIDDKKTTEKRGCSMTVRCSKLFNFSVQNYSTEALIACKHSSSLDMHAICAEKLSSHSQSRSDLSSGVESRVDDSNPLAGVCLNIDPFLQGVGGDDSWSACVHEGYLLPPAEYHFKIAMSFHYQ